MKPKQAVIAANVNYHTARKWKSAQAGDPEGKIPTKMTNKTPGRPASQLNDVHKTHLVDFLDEDPTATIQDAIESLTTSFGNLQIKKIKGCLVYEGRV
ncbi:hypothetical protein BDC45DRAFT_585706 [Circinella umbellata]|nr:hypothetical protein BDC45DRAFT_585706 [Circinella umbellata]